MASLRTEEESTGLREKPLEIWLLLVSGIFGVALILGAKWWEEASAPHPETARTWRHSMEEVGIAFIVAGIVGGTIEGATHRRELRRHRQRLLDIQNNVFRSAFGFSIQKDVLDEIVESVFKIKFMRKAIKLRYFFEPIPKGFQFREGCAQMDENQLLKLTITVEYLLENMSTEPQNTDIVHYFEVLLPLDADQSKFTAFCISNPKSGERLIELGGNGKEKVKLDCDHPLRRKLAIASDNLKVIPGQPLKIGYTHETIRRRRDFEVWVSTLPADGFLIEARVDPSLSDLEFFTDASHRKVPEETVRLSPNVYEWRIQSGILPSQGVMIFWKPKESPKPLLATASQATQCFFARVYHWLRNRAQTQGPNT